MESKEWLNMLMFLQSVDNEPVEDDDEEAE